MDSTTRGAGNNVVLTRVGGMSGERSVYGDTRKNEADFHEATRAVSKSEHGAAFPALISDGLGNHIVHASIV